MAERERAPIALRLALTFVGVAMLAVAIVVGLGVALGGRDINAMVQQREADLTQSLRTTAAATYNTGTPGWSDTDLRPALDLALTSGTNVAVIDGTGQVVATTPTDPSRLPGAQRSPITAGGRRIGTLVVSFNSRGLADSAGRLRSSLATAVVGAAGLAALLALVVALVVARRLTRPVTLLIAATRAMSGGDRGARVGRVDRAPRELQELAGTFDGMADAVAHHEKLRRDLVSDVAHELRTPVAILQANCEALLDGVVPHTMAEIASLHEEVVRLAGLVDDLQALASADAAALHLRPVPCDLAVLVGSALDALSASLTAAGLTVTRQLAPAPIEGDPTRLHQMITNVLANSRKFTPSGGRIDVALTTATGHAQVRVSDTGIGIATADQPHIFERFRRGANAEDFPGSGVGLAIVAELVQAHNGTLEVQSRFGEGTTVVISLPLAAVPVA